MKQNLQAWPLRWLLVCMSMVFGPGLIMEAWAQTTLLTDDFSPTTLPYSLTSAGWSAHSAGGTNSIIASAPNLTYAGLTTLGGSATLTTSGEDVNKVFSTTVNSGSIYASLIISLPSSSTTGDYFFHLGPGNIGNTFIGRVYAKSSGVGFQLGISKGTDPAGPVYNETVYTFNTTYFIVLKYTFKTGSTQDDQVDLFITPVLGQPEPTASATTSSTITDLLNAGSVALRQSSASTRVRIDYIRVGTSWESVTAPIIPVPFITVNPPSLTAGNGLSYIEGGSASRAISVSATSLTGVPGSVTVTTSDGTNFAVSSDGSTFGSSATLPYSTSTLSATTVTVRLNSGLAVGSAYATTLTLSGGGATATVPVTGTVLADNTPFLTATPTSLTGFSTTVGTPSTTKTYALTGINLTGPVSISASAGYELSPDGITFASTTTVAPVSGTVNQTVFVRLTGVAAGTFNGTISNVSTGLTATVALSGTVVPPPSLSANPTALSGFTTVEGIASTTQTFTITAVSLPAALTITAPTGVSISLNGTTFAPSLTLAASTTSATLVARLSGATSGPVNGNINVISGSLSALITISGTVSAAPPVVYHYLGGGAFTQDWTNTGQITTNDIWYNVPSVRGYRGDDLTGATGTDPQTLTDGTNGYVANVIANQTNTGNSSGGISEFEITNPVVALQGSGTADAPFLQIHLNTTGVNSISVSYNLRDVDGTSDNSVQPIALQYRVGTTGDFINVPAAFVSDASSASSATQVTAVSVVLPTAAENQFRIQLRILTTNAVGNDEWIGIDDIVITGVSSGPVTPGLFINDLSTIEGNSGTKELQFTVNSSIPAPAGGITFDIGTVNGSATAGSDYVAKTLTSQTIPAGSDTYTFSVTVNSDVTPEPNESFSVVISNPVGATIADAQGIGSILNDDAVPVQIHDIQGPGHVSPYEGQPVTTTGVVTAVRGSGFYIQDTNPDADDLTSEGILVFTSTPPTGVSVGAIVSVTGTVDEFRAGGNTSLGITEISTPTYLTLSVGNPLPTPILLSAVAGVGVRKIPTERIYNDSTTPNSDVEATTFDPTDDGIDFYETLEGMLVQINNPITLSFGSAAEELWVLPDNGNGATARNLRGGVTISGNDEADINAAIINSDFNPEKIQIDDSLNDAGITVPTNLLVGSLLNTIQGIVSYSSSNYEVLALASPTVATSSTLTKETTTLIPQLNKLTIATFNVENLDPGDGAVKFTALANAIVTNLQSPDILVIEEIQDNSGPTNNGVVSASLTSQSLISAISAVGGPTYEFREIAPVDGTNGGEPGGNIRVGFLFNSARVSFIDRPGGSATSSISVNTVGGLPQLSSSPGLIDPTNPTFTGSRKPLVGEFQFNGQTIFVIGNHFTSRGGSESLFQRFQPPVQGGQTQRETQAAVVNTFIDQLLTVNPMAKIAVMGDFNEFHFLPALQILKGNVSGQTPVLTNLLTTLPVGEQYTYYFDGNAQALDHMLVSNGLFSKLDQFDVVHMNAEFPDQISDHDPSLARFTILPLSATLVASSSVECLGKPVTLSATVAELAGATYSLTITNGTNQTTASGLSATAISLTLATTVPNAFTLTVLTSNSLATSAVSGTVTVNSGPAAPTYTLTNNGTVCAGNALTVTANGCNSGIVSFTVNPAIGSGIVLPGPPAFYVFAANTPAGTYTVCARCTDPVGGCTSPMAITTVTINPNPTITISATPSLTLCPPGASATLTASGAGTGGTYRWNTSETQSFIVVNAAQTYSVTGITSGGCSGTASVTTFTTNAPPPPTLAASSSIVCQGNVVSVASSYGGAASSSFQWIKDGLSLGTAQQNPTLTLSNVQPEQSGSYVLAVSGACGSLTSTAFTLTVNPAPTITLTFPGGTLAVVGSLPTIQLPTPGQVLVQASGGTSYNWVSIIDRINGYEVRKTDNNASGLFTIDKPGPYRVTVTGANGCTRTAEGLIVN